MLPKGKYRILQKYPVWGAHLVTESFLEKVRYVTVPEGQIGIVNGREVS